MKTYYLRKSVTNLRTGNPQKGTGWDGQSQGCPSPSSLERSEFGSFPTPPEASPAREADDSASLSMSHNSNVTFQDQPDLPFFLTGSQKKTAFALRHNVERLIKEDGINSVVFVTLTVGDLHNGKFAMVFDSAEANKRFNSLSSGLLRSIFKRFVVVTERHKNKAVHFHLVGSLANLADVRTGFDFEAVARRDYSSASGALRGLWSVFRENLPSYGFGRAEAMPIRSCGAAVAAYVSKYIEKNLFNRLAEDKGKRLVRYHGFEGSHLKPNNFAWGSKRACAWRNNARKLAGLVGVESYEQVSQCFGPRWAFRLSRVMNAVAGDDQSFVELSHNYAVLETARGLVGHAARQSWVQAHDSARRHETPVIFGAMREARRNPEFCWN